ncbi:MAG: phosphoserine phosphatase SerB [Alphaproteobacteria bacterium]
MQNVLTIIAGIGETLRPVDIGAAADALGAAGARTGTPDPLAEGFAADIPFEGIDTATADAAARTALAGRRLDLGAQTATGRRKRLLVADMESTIIENEMLDELADELGLREQIAGITARAMNGELDFAAALRERVGLLAGLPEAALERAGRRIRAVPGAAVLVATMRAHGAFCALVSGGFTYYTGRVRREIGFDIDQANRLEVADGKLTGRVGEPILGREAKEAALRRLAAERGIGVTDAIAVGDGANDLAMLAVAGAGVAFRAKPIVAAQARLRVDHADLTALLYLQGYRRAAFVAA